MAMRPVERLLATARAEIGYIEKETPAKPRHEGLVSITE